MTEQVLRDAESLAGRIFGDSPQQIREQEDELVQRWRDAPGSFEMWVVRDEEGHVVCSGRIDFVEGTDFAALWGGACDRRTEGLASTGPWWHNGPVRPRRAASTSCRSTAARTPAPSWKAPA